MTAPVRPPVNAPAGVESAIRIARGNVGARRPGPATTVRIGRGLRFADCATPPAANSATRCSRPSAHTPASVHLNYPLSRVLVRFDEAAPSCADLCESLADAGVKITPVIADVLGKSGRAMLEALIAGERDPHALAENCWAVSPASANTPRK